MEAAYGLSETHTGDMGRYDQDGYVYFLGRRKEMIKCSGYAVAPEEVEDFLMRHPAVEQAVCIPVPDARRGQAVKAFIVLKPGQAGRVSVNCSCLCGTSSHIR